ncbi:MAG: LysR family transcriptional regulator [bacterium]
MLRIDRITLKQIRAFAATIQHGSIAAAADELNVTAPAISLQLKLLTETLGLPLYERSPTGLKPTSAGREVMVVANRIQTTMSGFEQAITYLTKGEDGQITFGAISTAKYFAPHMIAAFNKLFPALDVRVQIGNREQIIAALESQDIDFAIMGRPPERLNCERVVIGTHPHILIAAPTHPLADRKNITMTDLVGERFLLREKGSGTHSTFQELLQQCGLNPDIGVEFGSNETIKQSVMAGIGVALISAHTVMAELREERLIQLNIVELPIIRHWFLIKPAERILMPSTTKLWNFIANDGKNILPDLKTD